MPTAENRCPCVRKGCPRHGDCSECISHHRSEGKMPVYCMRKLVKQITDRSSKKQAPASH